MGITGVCMTMTDSGNTSQESDGYHWSMCDND